MLEKRHKYSPLASNFPPLIVLFLLGGIAYANSFSVPFHFDDNRNIVNNPLIQSFHYFLDPSQSHPFPGYRDFIMRFVGFFSFALNYSIHGLALWGYHGVNIAIHIGNAWIVYYFIVLTMKTPNSQSAGSGTEKHLQNIRGLALLAACLFVVHPIQTQAVTYIVQRFASLATLFYLLSLLFYIRWRISSGPIYWYCGSLLFSLLAFKTKEIAFSLPIIILTYEWLFFTGTFRRRVLYLLPYGILSLVIPLSYLITANQSGNVFHDVFEQSKVLTDMSRFTYLFTEFRVMVTYIRLLFVPVHQNFDYDYPLQDCFWDLSVWTSFLLLFSLLSVAAISLLRASREDSRYRIIALGIFWFFLTLLPESGLIPIVDVIYEHRLYLPSVGAFMAISSAYFLLGDSIPAKYFVLKKYSPYVCFVLIGALTGMTIQRNEVWQSEISLWEDVVKKSPTKVRALTNLGSAYMDRGFHEPALEQFEKALALDPHNEILFANIATVYYKQSFVFRDRGMFEKAAKLLDRSIAYYERSLALHPAHAMIQNYLEEARRERNRYILKKE